MIDRRLAGDNAPDMVRIIFIVFAVVLAFSGGSSRYDLVQVLAIIPAAVLCGAAALYFLRAEDARPVRWVWVLLLALTVLMMIQLVPLPHGLWSSLPGRSVPAALDTALGLDPMRPLSLSPSRTLHALFMLSIPLAAVIVFIALRRDAAYWTLTAIVSIAAFNAVVGLTQELLGNLPFLYFYSVTIAQASVGIFANPNHASVFGALVLVIIAFAIVSLAPRHENRARRTALVAAYILVALANFVNTSRAGLLTTLIALLFTGVLFARPYLARRFGANKGAKKPESPQWLRIAAVVVVVGIVTALFYLLERSPAVAQLVAEDPLEDLRFLITPTLIDMVGTYFPIGAGFGAFESSYYIAEDRNLLMSAYLNHAHNDWLQWLIEGGLPAALILVAFGFFFIRAIYRLWRSDVASAGPATARSPRSQSKGPASSRSSPGGDLALTALAALFIVSVASYGDYPLRTPIFQVVCVWLICLLATASPHRNNHRSKHARTVRAEDTVHAA